MKLSEILKQYRADNGLSQREFAKQCGLSNSYISFIENEKDPKTLKPPILGITKYKDIATAMGMLLHDLLLLLGDDAPISLDDVQEDYTYDEKALISAYRAADEHARKYALDLLLANPKKGNTKKSAM